MTQRTGLSLALLVAAAVAGGCDSFDSFKTDETRFLSPEKVIKAPRRSPINPILPSVGPADESQELAPNAVLPGPEDLVYDDRDYVIGPTDILDISVLDLFQVGVETPLRREVSASGHISLPLLKENIKASERTKDELRRAICEAYIEAEILRHPTVSITISARRQSVFSILGAVTRPGTYNVVRRDMRLLEALALAAGVTQSNIRYLYVIRQSPPRRKAAPARTGPDAVVEPGELPEIPSTRRPSTEKPPAGGGPDGSLDELREALPEPGGPARGVPAVRPARPARTRPAATSPARPDAKAPGNGQWKYVKGEWLLAPRAAAPSAADRPAVTPARRGFQPSRHEPGTDPADPFGWLAATKAGKARIIAINLATLKNGDPRMNIVIRENDVIHVPTLEVGEFYVMGEVLRPGVYSLTGRRVTVKMAVAAAGNLAPLAWPENSILVRRVGDHQEQVIPLNIEEIFRGERPDVYLKPNDVIAVGTDVRAPFWAVVRNAFRMTYGFGFIYDRNFADPFVGPLDSRRFTRW